MRNVIIYSALVGILFGCDGRYLSKSELTTRPTLEGCKFVERKFNYADTSLRTLNETAVNPYSHYWSGRCESGFIDGFGYLTYIKNDTPRWISWRLAKVGSPIEYSFEYDLETNIGQYYHQNGRSSIPEIIDPYQCANDSGCMDLRNARVSILGLEKVERDEDDAAQAINRQKEIIARRRNDEELERKTFREQMDLMRQEVERESGEQKRKWLAEKNANFGQDSANQSSLIMIGALAQGVAAARGGKNAAQLQALGSALQGGSASTNATTGAYQGNSSGSAVSEISPTSPSVDHCVKLGRPRRHQVSFSNSCNFPIQVTYCFTDISGNSSLYDASDAVCQKMSKYHASATPVIPAGESNIQNAPDNRSNINFIACPSGETRMQSNFRWEGVRIQGSCGGVIGRENNANKGSSRSGGIR